MYKPYVLPMALYSQSRWISMLCDVASKDWNAILEITPN